MPLWSKIAIGLLVAGMAAIGYLLFGRPAPPAPDPPDYVAVAASLSQFDDQLARVALAQLGSLPGLGIRPTDAEVPIGTLFVPGRSLDLDEDACRADPVPTAYAASAFPDFTVKNGVAASVGLGPDATRSLASAGAQIAQNSEVTIHFDALSRQYLDDHKLAALLARPACLAALSDGPVSMIRGYFRGQRSFVLQTARTGKLSASLAKIGDFDVSKGAGDSSVVLKDPSDFGFLQLYTQVAATPAPVPSPAPAPSYPPGPTAQPTGPAGHARPMFHHDIAPHVVPAATPVITAVATVATVAAAPLASQGHLYIQRDQLDRSQAATAIAAALSQAGFPVIAKVEAIPSAKMPTAAQVRYFNGTDIASASKALAILRTRFPGAQLKRIALPSPPGQLEVWLPKVAA